MVHVAWQKNVPTWIIEIQNLFAKVLRELCFYWCHKIGKGAKVREIGDLLEPKDSKVHVHYLKFKMSLSSKFLQWVILYASGFL
jgi:hypothetical protein